MNMRDSQAKTTYLKDYKPPEFCIKKTSLSFDLYEDKTREKAVPEFAKISNSLISFSLGISDDSKNNFSTLILKAFASGKFVKSNVADAIKTINKKARMLNATLLLKRSFSRLFKTLFPF